MAKVKIEGQTLELDNEIAESDELLRAALQATWPDAKTAQFSRSGEGDKLVVTVTKKAGTKGNLIDALLTAEEGVSPAITMSARIAEMQAAGEIDPVQIVKMIPEIGAAADLAERDVQAAAAARSDLEKALPIVGGSIPMGF